MIDVFHIGYPRCGSTWLQRIFFPSARDNINLIEKYMENEITNKDDFYFDNKLKERIRRQAIENKTNIYSSEALVGYTALGNFSRTCKRLKEISPSAKILIIIRNQKDLLESLYKYGISYGYLFSEKVFLGKYCEKNNVFDILKFDKVINCYQKEFKNVHVELFERLFQEKNLKI